MLKAVLLQFCTAILGCALGVAFFGWRGGLAAAIGGLACVVPNLLFALRLHAVARGQSTSHVSAFFIGEAIKIVLTIALLASAYLAYPGLHWGAVVMGLIVTLQANFLALLVKP